MKFPIYMEKNNPNVPKHQPVINHRSFAKRCLPDCSWLRFPPNHTLELGSWEYKIGFLPSPHHVATPRLKFKSSVFSHFRIHFRIIIRSGKKNHVFLKHGSRVCGNHLMWTQNGAFCWVFHTTPSAGLLLWSKNMDMPQMIQMQAIVYRWFSLQKMTIQPRWITGE